MCPATLPHWLAMRGCYSTPAIASSARRRSTCFQTPRTSRRSSLSRARRLHEAFEQLAELPGPPEILRMPLHRHAEGGIRLFHRFNDAIGRGRRDVETRGHFLHRLVMAAVDVAGLAVLHVIR